MNEQQHNNQHQIIIPRFINASEVKAKGGVDEYKVGDFIRIFNHSIKNKRFTLNNGLDKITSLSDDEFQLAKMIAKEDGWNLTRFDDNYNTITYKIEKL